MCNMNYIQRKVARETYKRWNANFMAVEKKFEGMAMTEPSEHPCMLKMTEAGDQYCREMAAIPKYKVIEREVRKELGWGKRK